VVGCSPGPHYQSAQAKIRLHESDLIHELRPSGDSWPLNRIPKTRAVSPNGPLTREELDLIEVPGSGLALEGLLPPKAMKIGSQWPLAEATIARLLGLEAVSQQDVSCTLDSVKENVAIRLTRRQGHRRGWWREQRHRVEGQNSIST